MIVGYYQFEGIWYIDCWGIVFNGVLCNDDSPNECEWIVPGTIKPED